jgi:acetyl esterase/lipase
MPESNGLEILSDIQDFWIWIQNDLAQYLKAIGSDITPDYEKVLAYGESAGGYLAIQSALTRPDLVKAVVAAYPMTYVDSPWYAAASTTKSPLGGPQIPKKILDDHIAAIPKDKICAGAFPPDRMMLALSALQSGELSGLIGTDDALFPARILEKVQSGQNAPFLFTFHGTEDSAVPCEETKRFLSSWLEKFGPESGVGRFMSGDHGLDAEWNLETPWMKEGLVGVTKAWLG